MRKISITEALVELKLYDSKINKAITNAKFVGTSKKLSDKIGVTSKENFKENAKASYQSITDLIKNRNTLKSAIVKSNANTEVTINQKTMTVAEVIERKNSINYEKDLLNAMKAQYATATITMERENKKTDTKVDELLVALVSKESNKEVSREAQEVVEKHYRDKNEWELVDGINIYEKMLALEADIDGFLANCDTTLSVANATSFIEINF